MYCRHILKHTDDDMPKTKKTGISFEDYLQCELLKAEDTNAYLTSKLNDTEALLETAELDNEKLEKKIAELTEQMDNIIKQTLGRHGRCDDGMGGEFSVCP